MPLTPCNDCTADLQSHCQSAVRYAPYLPLSGSPWASRIRSEASQNPRVYALAVYHGGSWVQSWEHDDAYLAPPCLFEDELSVMLRVHDVGAVVPLQQRQNCQPYRAQRAVLAGLRDDPPSPSLIKSLGSAPGMNRERLGGLVRGPALTSHTAPAMCPPAPPVLVTPGSACKARLLPPEVAPSGAGSATQTLYPPQGGGGRHFGPNCPKPNGPTHPQATDPPTQPPPPPMGWDYP